MLRSSPSKTPVRFRHIRGKVSKPNPDASCVDRSSNWGNPFRVGDYGHEQAVALHRVALLGDQAEAERVLGYIAADVRKHLAVRDLGCYCGLDKPCHADTLLEVANGPERLIESIKDVAFLPY